MKLERGFSRDSVDPLAAKYPHNSPYAFSENVVINAVEFEGLEKWELSNNNTFMETFFGPFSMEYLDEQQSKVDHYENIRQKTAAVLLKVEAADISNLTIYPIEPSPFLIYDVPVEVTRDNGNPGASYAITNPEGSNKIEIHPSLDKKDEGFQVAVFAHEYAAHYLEGILDLIKDDKGNILGPEEISDNPFFNPELPESGNNAKTYKTRAFLGSIGTAKTEVNGWGLMKSLHDNNFIKLNVDDYNKCVKNIEMYTRKVEKLEKISEDGN